MGKGLYVLYGCLLLSVYFLRQLDFDTNKKLQSFLDNTFQEEDGQVEDSRSHNKNSTFQRKLQSTVNSVTSVDSTPTTNQDVISICSASSDGGKVSQSDIDAANRARSTYKNSFGPSIGDDLLNQRVPSVGSQSQKIIIIGLIALFFIITPWLTICYCCYCCCDKKCPLCCKDDMKKKPFTRGQLLCNLIFVVVLASLTLAASIAGYVYSNKINSSYKSMKCTIVSALDNLNQKQTFTLNTGAQGIFLGLNGLQSTIQTVNGQLDNWYISIQNFQTTNQPSIATLSSTSQTIQNMFTSMKSTPLAIGYTHDTNQGWQDSIPPGTTRNSIFFDSTNYPKLIDGMISAQQSVTSAAISAINQASTECTNQANQGRTSVSSALSSALTSIQSGQNMISDSVNSIKKNTQITDTIFQLVTIFLMIFYGIFMFIAVAGAALAFLGHVKNMYKVRACLHFFWCLLGLLTFLGFLLTLILGILTILMMDTCDAANKYLNDPTYFNSVNLGSSDLKSYLTTCKAELGGDGNILKKFNIDSQVQQITKTQQSLQTAMNSFDMNAYQLFESNLQYFKFSHQMIQKYGVLFARNDQNWSKTPPNQMGSYQMSLDYQEAEAAFSLQTGYLSYQTTTGNPYTEVTSANNDIFVFQDNQCAAYGYASVLQNFNTAISSKSCVSYQTSSDQFSSAASTTRYNVSSPYDDFYSRIISYVMQANNMYDKTEQFKYTDATTSSQVTVPGIKRDAFIDIIMDKSSSSANPGFGYQLNTIVGNIKTSVLDGSKAITDSLIGPSGLIYQVNCLFLGFTIQNFYEQMCDNSAISIYITFQIMCVLCFSNFVLMIFLYKIAMKFLGKQKEVQDKPNAGTVMPSCGAEMQKLNIN
ncbi:hypothetical protein ABPG72_001596 [Tetrahymena utriculariae]